MFFAISPVEMLKYSLQCLVGIAVEELTDTREMGEEGPNISDVIFRSLQGTEAGPEVGEIVANQLVVGVGHDMVVSKEYSRLERIWNLVLMALGV